VGQDLTYKTCKYYRRPLRGIRNDISKYYYDFNHGTGGYLHIVTDDYNLEDYHIQLCLDDIRESYKREYDTYEDKGRGLARRIGEALLKCNMPERVLVTRSCYETGDRSQWNACWNEGNCDKCAVEHGNAYFESEAYDE